MCKVNPLWQRAQRLVSRILYDTWSTSCFNFVVTQIKLLRVTNRNHARADVSGFQNLHYIFCNLDLLPRLATYLEIDTCSDIFSFDGGCVPILIGESDPAISTPWGGPLDGHACFAGLLLPSIFWILLEVPSPLEVLTPSSRQLLARLTVLLSRCLATVSLSS